MTGRLICLHGLGEGPDSWDAVLAHLGMEALCPSLPELLKGRPARYENLRQAFFADCQRFSEPLHLCGLSLGGVLALDYAMAHSERVKSLVLIGTPLDIPRGLLRFQSAVFRLMPARTFQGTGFSKKDFLSLAGSMADLNLRAGLEKAENLNFPALLLCGERDRANRRAAQELSWLLPHVVFRQIQGAGHVVNQDAPETLAAVLREFYIQCG